MEIVRDMIEKQDILVQTAIKLPESELEHADKLAKQMSHSGLRLTRTALLRMAINRGLSQLDAEAKAKR